MACSCDSPFRVSWLPDTTIPRPLGGMHTVPVYIRTVPTSALILWPASLFYLKTELKQVLLETRAAVFAGLLFTLQRYHLCHY